MIETPRTTSTAPQTKSTTWIIAIVIVGVVAIVAVATILVLYRVNGGRYHKIHSKLPPLTREMFLGGLSAHERSDQERQRKVLIRTALANRDEILRKELELSKAPHPLL